MGSKRAGRHAIGRGAVRAGVRRFIYASSGSVYGVQNAERVTEELPLVPISVYNKTKMVAERVLLSYAGQMEIYCVRPATVCGVSPRQRLDVAVNMLTLQALENGKITVFGGDQTRPNIHIKDLVRIYLHLLDSAAAPGIYNAGFENLSIREIAERVQAAVPCEIITTSSNDPAPTAFAQKLLPPASSPAIPWRKPCRIYRLLIQPGR